MTLITSLVLIYCVSIATAFRLPHNAFVIRRSTTLKSEPAGDKSNTSNDFDGKSFDEALKKMGPVWGKKLSKPDSDTLNNIRAEQDAKATEEIFRKYPFEETQLPVLPDCNNYYSGKFGDYFWHQNSDQVFVYIPVAEDVTRQDVKANFQARSVTLHVKDVEEISFKCMERIIPDGSFWTFETDQNGKKYVQLDLEKRFRMINWKTLFGEPAPHEEADVQGNRAKVMEKLLAANKGLSNLTGMEPETMREMMANGELTKMIADEVYLEPKVSVESDGVSTSVVVTTPKSAADDDSESEPLDVHDEEILDAEMIDSESSD